MSITGIRGAIAASLVAAISLTAHAEDKVPPVDRDGKPICGVELMSERELNGYHSLLFFTKTLAERDAVREEHCKAMRKRAEERGQRVTG